MRAKISALLVSLLLVGCSSVSLSPHKIEIQQGNLVTREMVAKLKPGMTKSQVRFVLGSPLIVDAFHNDRWDYVYRLEQQGRLTKQSKLAVFFVDDKLVRLDSDFAPSFAADPSDPEKPDGADSPDMTTPAAGLGPAQSGGENTPTTDQPQEERGFFGSILKKIGL